MNLTAAQLVELAKAEMAEETKRHAAAAAEETKRHAAAEETKRHAAAEETKRQALKLMSMWFANVRNWHRIYHSHTINPPPPVYFFFWFGFLIISSSPLLSFLLEPAPARWCWTNSWSQCEFLALFLYLFVRFGPTVCLNLVGVEFTNHNLP